MEQQIQEYINSVIQECLTSVPGLDRNKLEDYFSQIVLETLIHSLSDEQAKELENLDFNKPEDIAELQLLAASIPNFLLVVDEILKQEVEQIKKTGQIPQA